MTDTDAFTDRIRTMIESHERDGCANTAAAMRELLDAIAALEAENASVMATNDALAQENRDKGLRIEALEGALREAANIAENACLVPPDGGEPTEAERLMCEDAARRIRALDPQRRPK